MSQKERQEEFIKKANIIHNNKYDYSKVKYINAHTNVEIICEIDGLFFQTPNNHLREKGCRQCAIRNSQLLRKQPLEEFIKEAKEMHGDKYNYDLVVYENKKSKIKIKCIECNKIFEQIAELHKRGANCPICAKNDASRKQKITFEEFKKHANIIHKNKYNYSLAIFIDLNSDIEIICPEHEKFIQKALYHYRGNECHECAEEQRRITFKQTQNCKLKNIVVVDDIDDEPKQTNAEKFIEKAKKVHDDKYDYSLVIYINSSTNVKIKCIEHGIFEQTPRNHLHQNCPKCSKEINNAKYRFSTDDFIKKAIEIHKDKYDYSKINYINYGTNVEIVCPKLDHGSFFQTPSNHLSHLHGCTKCRDELNSLNKGDTKEEFIEKSNKVHDNKYDYSKVNYVNGNTKVEIICITHGSFYQTPKSHIQGTNCPKCMKKNFSMKAIDWLEYVSKKENITIQHAMNDGEYKLPTTNIRVDGFCQETNTVFLFHGIFYHGAPQFYNHWKINPVIKKSFGELYIKTLEQEVQIHKLDYNVVIMWEHVWDQFCKFNKNKPN